MFSEQNSTDQLAYIMLVTVIIEINVSLFQCSSYDF